MDIKQIFETDASSKVLFRKIDRIIRNWKIQQAHVFLTSVRKMTSEKSIEYIANQTFTSYDGQRYNLTTAAISSIIFRKEKPMENENG